MPANSPPPPDRRVDRNELRDYITTAAATPPEDTA
jgi:hypothetical protein